MIIHMQTWTWLHPAYKWWPIVADRNYSDLTKKMFNGLVFQMLIQQYNITQLVSRRELWAFLIFKSSMLTIWAMCSTFRHRGHLSRVVSSREICQTYSHPIKTTK